MKQKSKRITLLLVGALIMGLPFLVRADATLGLVTIDRTKTAQTIAFPNQHIALTVPLSLFNLSDAAVTAYNTDTPDNYLVCGWFDKTTANKNLFHVSMLEREECVVETDLPTFFTFQSFLPIPVPTCKALDPSLIVSRCQAVSLPGGIKGISFYAGLAVGASDATFTPVQGFAAKVYYLRLPNRDRDADIIATLNLGQPYVLSKANFRQEADRVLISGTASYKKDRTELNAFDKSIRSLRVTP